MLQSETNYQMAQIPQKTIIQLNSNRIVAHQSSDDDEEKPTLQLPAHNKYGNMVILYQGMCLINLGPDYLCFLPTFTVFCVASYFVISLVLTSTTSFVFHFVTIVITVGQPLSYLLVALSNPGIVTRSAQRLDDLDKKKCNKCNIIVPRHARHCSDCNVCVQHYDHHCPWTSKCIGGGNLIRFYVFLGWTPIYLIYITIAFVVCMSANLSTIQHIQKLI